MGISELKADLKTYEERLAGLAKTPLTPEEFQAAVWRELSDNLVPLMGAVTDVLAQDALEPLEELGAAVDQLIDQSDDLLQPTTSQQIQAVFAMAVALVKDLEPLIAKADDLTRKRLTDGVTGFRHAVNAVVQLVQEITLEEDQPPGPGDEGDDDDGGDDDEEDGDE